MILSWLEEQGWEEALNQLVLSLCEFPCVLWWTLCKYSFSQFKLRQNSASFGFSS